MKANTRIMQQGFTLIEMMLVMVIISMLIYLGGNYMQQKMQAERIDRTSLQMQQILNAALAYYVANSSWPIPVGNRWTSTDVLQEAGYLSEAPIANPWGPNPSPGYPSSYSMLSLTPNGAKLAVLTYIGSSAQMMANAQVIAGKLPMGNACSVYNMNPSLPDKCLPCSSNAACYVVATVSIPGQNLNNATAVNYAGLYHSGACVKAPSCPLSTMTPQIMVVPVSVAGVNDAPTGSSCSSDNLPGCTSNTYPISNFTGSASGLPVTNTTGTPAPYDCQTRSVLTPCISNGTTNAPLTDPNTSAQYWRVCLSVATAKGTVTPTNNQQGLLMGTVMVLTRCVPANENLGSGFDVYQ